MKKRATLLLMVMPVFALAAKVQLTKAQILSRVQAEASADCNNKNPLPGPLTDCKPAGCDFYARFDAKTNTWDVHARYTFKNSKGEEISPDGGTWYLLSPTGKLLQKLIGE